VDKLRQQKLLGTIKTKQFFLSLVSSKNFLKIL